MASFSNVPVLDWKLTELGHRDQFLLELRHAASIGFLYLQNPPVDVELTNAIKHYAVKIFELPHEVKHGISMINSPHFLGYSRLGAEITKGKLDYREQFDFGKPFECQYSTGEPEYTKLWGPPQWPPEDTLPGFRETFTSYIQQVEDLSFGFIQLFAESLGLPANAFDGFYDVPKGAMQHRSKIVKYPEASSESEQGVGPHYDSGFLTFLLQASEQLGLEVQNVEGEWIPVPPKNNTLVVNFGKENVTHYVARATCHRVISPRPGDGPRYSVPWFQSISQSIRLHDIDLRLPNEILALVRNMSEGKTDAINYQEYDQEVTDVVALAGRIKSHPDVAKCHYPETFEMYFPAGAPKLGNAY